MPTVAELVLAHRSDPHPAILFDNESYGYADLFRASLVRASVARHIRLPGRPFHIGVLLDNVPEFVFWIGGAAFAGATVVGINPTRRGQQLAADVRHTDCQLIVTDRDHLPLLAGLDLGLPADRVWLVDDARYRSVLDEHRHAGVPAELPPAESLLMLLFTSGSTGAPKAVICTTGRLARIARTASANFGLTRDDVLYQSMPLFHGNAIMANWLPALGQGATMALRARFSASGFLPDVRRFGATYFNYVGRALAYILATPPTPFDADNGLRLGFGTEASAQDMERFASRFGCTILENYGSSEGVISLQRQPGTPRAALGKPLDGPQFDVIVANPTTGEECPPARFDRHGRIENGDQAIGELVNRAGAPSFEGYYHNAEAMADRLRGGWYWSGDLAYRDADGWFYFAGRGSDWLRVDSENFSAAPIERILHRHPDVVMAAVYPVPDSRTGDQVMAALELRENITFDPAGFLAFLHAQPDLGTKWTPRYVRIVSRMPLTVTNKINKQPLRSERWSTADPVYWTAARGERYRKLTPEDVETLHQHFVANGRAHLLAIA